jgi:hypothetical protein
MSPRCDGADAIAHACGDNECNRGGAEQRESQSRDRGSEHGSQLLTDVGQRERDANECDRWMLNRSRDVQHVDAERGAEPACRPETRRLRLQNFGPRRVILKIR